MHGVVHELVRQIHTVFHTVTLPVAIVGSLPCRAARPPLRWTARYDNPSLMQACPKPSDQNRSPCDLRC